MSEDQKALAVKETAGALGIPEELVGFSGLEGIDASTFIIPRIKIVQPTTREADATPGKLRINLTGDEFGSIPVILIKAIQGRTLWDPKPGSDIILCRSYDFLKPDSSIEKPYSDYCAKKVKNLRGQDVLSIACDCAKWHGDTKPECTENYNLLCLQNEDLLPFWITLHGASISPVRKYLSAIALRRSRLFQWCTTLSTEMKMEPQKYYVARFSTPLPVAKEAMDSVTRTILDLGLMDIDIKRTEEAEESVAATGGEDSDNAPPKAPDFLKF